MKIQASDSSILINGNKGALLGALANLCMNAIDASDQLLNIKITTALNRRGDLELAVTDNAGGMDEQTLPHLFDPFYTTKQDGTGLGLAVVKSVIESHQGQIKVSSTLGEGSRFDITLPCITGSKTQLSTHKSEANK